LFVNKYFIRNNTPNEYHTCHIQLSLNVHRIRFRPTRSIWVWLSGLRLYLQSDRDKTLHTVCLKHAHWHTPTSRVLARRQRNVKQYFELYGMRFRLASVWTVNRGFGSKNVTRVIHRLCKDKQWLMRYVVHSSCACLKQHIVSTRSVSDMLLCHRSNNVAKISTLPRGLIFRCTKVALLSFEECLKQ